MVGRIVIYIGVIAVGILLLLERPMPMAIAPSETQIDVIEEAG